MDIKKLYEKYIFRLTCCFFLTAAFAGTVNAYIGAPLNNILVIFFALLFSAAAAVFDVFAGKPVLYITVGAAAAALFAFSYVFEIPLFETVNSSFVWLFYESKSAAEASSAFSYALISMALTEAVTALFLFAVLRFKYVRFAVGGGLIITAAVLAFMEFNADSAAIFFIFSYIIMIFYEFSLKKVNYKYAAAYLLPFMLAAGLITAVLPSAENPIQWYFVKNLISSVQTLAYKIGDTFTVMFNSDSFEFGLNITGYSEDGKLLGRLANSDKEALLIRKSVNSGKSLYLTGTVMDKYTGESWERTDKGSFDSGDFCEYELDLLETLLAFNSGGLIEAEGVYAAREIEVFYRNLRTRSMFYPLKTLKINSVIPSDLKSGSLFLKNVSDEKTSYRLRYLDINYSSSEIINLLRNGADYSYNKNINAAELYRDLIKKTGVISLTEIPENYAQLLKNRRESIKVEYTQLPDTVKTEVYELSRDITANCANDYDKLTALENFLSGFEYTLSPPELSGELTYQLLFETGEGYCTYFATAFAVMARTLDIPTRYVQGYLTTFDEKAENNLYVIRNKNAHAWAEAYIDGIGWLPFEPTPGFTGTRYPEWEKKKPQTGSDLGYNPQDYINIISEEEFLAGEEQAEEDNSSFVLSILLIGGVCLIAVIAAVTFTFIFNMYRKKKKLNVNDMKLYYLDNFKYLVLFLKTLGNEPESGETFKSFSERLDDKRLAEITPVHQKIRYADKTPSSGDIEAVVKYKDELGECVKDKIGRFRYFMLIFK